MIWFSLIIPIVTIIVLVTFFHKRVTWWEYALQFIIPVIVIFSAKHISINALTKDKEYWNNYATVAHYDEAWDEYIHKTCSRESCSGSGKNRSCTTTYYDCSYVEDHPPEWYMYDNAGTRHNITQNYFNMMVGLWKNKTFKDLGRNYHSYDGDRYVTRWNKKRDIANVVTITTTHTYENRTQVPNEVFNYQKVDSTTQKQYGLYKYTWSYDRDNYTPIKGDKNAIANKILNMHNALNGLEAQLHTEILVFHDKPSMAGEWQKALWKGGNKNEFIICIGKKGNNIDWVNVFSWTVNEKLKIDVRNGIVNMKEYDIRKITDFVVSEVHPKFIRRQFKEFSYIQVNPSTKAVLITFLIVLLLSLGLAWYNVKNRFRIRGPYGR